MMCGICGCNEQGNLSHQNHVHDKHDVLSMNAYNPDRNLIKIEQDIFSKNNQIALSNRNHFLSKNILALNLMSSPGAGKTTLLVKTILDLRNRFKLATIEGDQQTNIDALRIEAAGATVIQINTGRSCHLDAHMISHSIEKLSLQGKAILFIENVGNLVCPALFDLGEAFKVVILSITEGEDKPLKYPEMFRAADLLILNKIDLLPYLEFDINKCIDYVHQINPDLQLLQLSASTGQDLNKWYQWLEVNYHNYNES